MKQKTTQLERDAAWVESFQEGETWLAGAFRPNRERELVALGVLVPVEGKPEEYRVGRRAVKA